MRDDRGGDGDGGGNVEWFDGGIFGAVAAIVWKIIDLLEKLINKLRRNGNGHNGKTVDEQLVHELRDLNANLTESIANQTRHHDAIVETRNDVNETKKLVQQVSRDVLGLRKEA